ncbi:MAG TPA: SRPBCC family protein [Thermoanaerobaculia bacterium]|nr:SRPBCC family protein [Thermoanaerobaculia bacterium]
MSDRMAKASTTIAAPAARVWDALVTPASVQEYMFGTTVSSDWQEGSAITWKGEWQGKAYEDKGVIRKLDAPRVLQYTHFSPLAGLPDAPENYHTVTVELSDRDGVTEVLLSQDNNPTEEAKEHSEKNWRMMLDGLKKFVESH